MKFHIPGAAIAKGRPRTTFKSGKAVTYTPKRTKEFSRMAALVAKNACQKLKAEPIPYPTPVRMDVTFTLNRQPTATPDLINLVVAICDVLQGGICYDNDSQVVELHAHQVKGKYPMTEIEVVPL